MLSSSFVIIIIIRHRHCCHLLSFFIHHHHFHSQNYQKALLQYLCHSMTDGFPLLSSKPAKILLQGRPVIQSPQVRSRTVLTLTLVSKWTRAFQIIHYGLAGEEYRYAGGKRVSKLAIWEGSVQDRTRRVGQLG